jgi:hypothetical protein
MLLSPAQEGIHPEAEAERKRASCEARKGYKLAVGRKGKKSLCWVDQCNFSGTRLMSLKLCFDASTGRANREEGHESNLAFRVI